MSRSVAQTFSAPHVKSAERAMSNDALNVFMVFPVRIENLMSLFYFEAVIPGFQPQADVISLLADDRDAPSAILDSFVIFFDLA